MVAGTGRADVVKGRHTADPPPGTVVFMIGMRINRPTRVRQWWPVFTAMPELLSELAAHPEAGMLGSRTYLSGRTVLLTQYWRDSQALERFATGRDFGHLKAWRAFNRLIGASGDVGIFHETYVIGAHETIYANMPAGFGLGGATSLVEVGRRGQRAAHRLDPSVPDEPAVDSY